MNRFAHIACVLACVLLAACTPRVELVGNVAEEEANEALGVLLRAGVDADKVPGKEGLVSIDVPRNQVSDAVGILKEQGLPRVRHTGMGDVFRKEGLVSSPTEERARYVFALSQELSETIGRMDGVVLARVHVVLPERSLDGEELTMASAAVFVKTLPQAHGDALLTPIKRLVAGSIPGLGQDRVSLVVVPEVVSPVSRPSAPAHPSLLLATGIPAALVAAAGIGVLVWRRRRKASRS